MSLRILAVVAFLVAGTAADAQTVAATASDVKSVLTSSVTSRFYPPAGLNEWEADLRAELKKSSVARASEKIAAKYGFTADQMRSLANAWIIAQSRVYDVREDSRWQSAVRDDVLKILPAVRNMPLGLAIATEALEAARGPLSCSATDFNSLMAGSTNAVADANLIADTATCTGNFLRAALAVPDRAMPALIRVAGYGGLTLRQALPLYSWLTSPEALARIAEPDRPRLSALLWQRYLEQLFKAGMETKALALLDALPPDRRSRILAARDTPLKRATVDGLTMTFRGESGSAYGRSSERPTADEVAAAADAVDAATDAAESLIEDLGGKAAGGKERKAVAARPAIAHREPDPAVETDVPTSAPIYKVAEALTLARRDAEARQLIATLPGLAAARRTAECAFDAVAEKRSSCSDSNRLPTYALVLDHVLNHPGEDPYFIAETTLSDNDGGTWINADIKCRAFPDDQFGGLCADARKWAAASADLDQGSGDADDRTLADTVLARLVPGFAPARAAFEAESAKLFGAHATGTELPRPGRATVIPVTPGYIEHPVPESLRGPASATTKSKFAALPGGYSLVRAEHSGTRAIAVSVSQTLDPTGELSQGGYWIHLSNDGGAHWQPPLYTGLADRFPYVVVARSRMPLLSGDTIHLAVDIAEIDTASITYPPVGLRTRRRATGLYLEIPLEALRKDSDGDGLTDIAARHLLLDKPKAAGATPFVVGSDDRSMCKGPVSPEREARAALLGKLFDPSAAAIVEPTDRSSGDIFSGWKRAAASAERPLFILGDPNDYLCLRPGRQMIVYDANDIAAMQRFTPDFHAVELPPITFNRERNRGFVKWSTGWAGGTYLMRRVKGQWKFDQLSSWIT